MRGRERSKQSSRKKEALNYEVWARWQHLARDWQPPSLARFVRQEPSVLSQRLSTCQSPSLPSLAVFDCLSLSVCRAVEISTSVAAVQWTCCNVRTLCTVYTLLYNTLSLQLTKTNKQLSEINKPKMRNWSQMAAVALSSRSVLVKTNNSKKEATKLWYSYSEHSLNCI